MVWFVFQFGLDFMDIRGEKVRRREKLSLGLDVAKRNEEDEEEVKCRFHLGFKWVVGPTSPKALNSWSYRLCVPDDIDEKEKMIVEKSSFQKVYFPHGLQISKIHAHIWCEKSFLPLSLKNMISKVQIQKEKT